VEVVPNRPKRCVSLSLSLRRVLPEESRDELGVVVWWSDQQQRDGGTGSFRWNALAPTDFVSQATDCRSIGLVRIPFCHTTLLGHTESQAQVCEMSW
jgi:hypothetical protein